MADVKTVDLGVAPTQGVIEAVELKWTRRWLLPRREWVPREPEVYDQDDWTIDGKLLRTILIEELGEFERDEEEYASPLSPRGDPRDAVTALEVLLGHKPAQCSDGRSAILVCRHDFDSYCRALTAEVTFTDHLVTWSLLREQSDAAEWQGEPAPVEFRFKRAAYEQTLRELLTRYRVVLQNWEAGR